MPRGLQAAQAQGSMDFKSYIRSSQALENLEKQLICPICVEMFSKPVVILPCQHNLCRKCAGEIFQTRGSTVGSGGRFRCPACRHEVLLDRHGVYGLQRNLLVENIIDIYKHESARPPSRSRRPSCEEHEEEKINIYCESCQIPICSLCKVFGTHQDCKVLPLTTVYQAQKAQLSDGIAVLMTGNDHIQKVLREMDKASRSVEESGRRSRQILCESFDALSSALHARRQAMLGAVLAAQESRSSLLAGTVTEFRDLQHTTSALLDRALQALDEPDMAAFLQSVMPLLKGIEESSDFSCVRVPEEDYEKLDDFAVNFDKELEALQKLDFVKEEEEEEIVEEEEEEEEDEEEEEEEEELVPCESRQNIEEERELENRGTEEIENAEGSDDIKEEDEDKETVERVMEDVASASAFLTPESELAFKFDDSRSTQLQVETSSHVWTFDDQSQSQENATEMERGTGDGQAEKGVERVSGIDEENKEVMKELVDMKREASAVGNIKTFEVEMKTDQSDEEEEESESTVMERTPVNGKAKETKMKHRKVRNVQEEVKDVKHIGKNTHMMELFEDEKEKVKEQEGIKKKGQSDEQETEEVIIESNGQDDEKDEGAEKLKDAIEKEEDITVEAEERGDDNRGEKKEESITEERGESGVKKLEEGKMVQNRGEVKKSECEAEEIICESEQVGIVFEAEKKGEIEINENEVQGEKTAKVDANQERGKEEKGKAEKTKEGQVGDENGNFIDKTGVRLEYNEDQMIKKEEDEKGEDEVSEIGKVRMEKEELAENEMGDELAENEAAEVLGEDFGEKQKDEGVVVLEDDEEGEGLGEGEEAEALGEGKEAEELGEGKEAEALGEGEEAEELGEGKEAEALGEGEEAEELGEGKEGEGKEAEALGEGKEAEALGEGKEAEALGEGKEAEALGEGKEAEALGDGEEGDDKEAEALGDGEEGDDKEAEALGDGEEGDDKEAEALGEGETETLGVEEGAEALGDGEEAEALGDGEEAEALGEGKEEEELGEGKEAEALGDGEREEELGDCEGAETLGDVEGAETLGAVEGAEPLGEGEEAEALGEGKEAETLGEGKEAEALGYGEREEALGDGEGAETLGAGEGAETLGDGEGAETLGDGEVAETLGDDEGADILGDGEMVETLGDGEGAEALGDGERAEALGDGERMEALGDGEGAEALGDGERAESLGDGEGTEELGNCEGAEALGGEEAEALGDDGPEELGDDEGAEALGVDKGAEALGVDDGVEALEVDKGVEALGVDEGVEALGVDEGVETLGDDEFGENEGEEEEEDLGENEPNEEEDLRENEPNEGVEELGENEAEENELGEGEDKLEDKEIGGEKIREDGVEEVTGNGNVDKISKDLMEEEKAHYEVQKDDYEENDKMVDDENSEIEEHKENEAEMKRKKVEDKESINKEEDETEKSEMGRKLDKLNVNDDDEVRVAAKTCVKDTVAQRDRKRKEKGDCIGENIETKILPQGGITAKARAQPFQRDKQKPMADQHKRKEMRIKRTKNKGGKKGEQNLKQNHGTKSEATETGEREHEETEQDGGDGVQNLEETRKAKGKYDGKKERNSQKEEEMVTEKGEDVAVSSPSNTSPPGPSPSHKSLTGWYQPKALSPSFRAPYPTAKTSPQPQAVTLTNCPLTQAVNSGASSAFHPTPIPQLMTPGLSGPSTDNTLVPKQPAQSLGGMRHEANSSKSQVPQKEQKM